MDVVDKAAEKLVKYLTLDHNILKVIEECAELQEVLVKLLTKNEETKPKREKIREEMGDVLFRMYVLMTHMNMIEDVLDRAEEKAAIMIEWADKKFEK